MDKLVAYAGWAVAIGASIAAILLYAEVQSLNATTQRLEREIEETQRLAHTRPARPTVEVPNRQELEAARARIRELESELEGLRDRERPPVAHRREREQEEQGVDAGALLENMLARPDEQETRPGPPQRRTRPVRAPGTRVDVDTVYGELMAELDLDPERAAMLRDVLAGFLEEVEQMGTELLELDADAASWEAHMEGLEHAMRLELEAVLGPDELLYFDEFQHMIAPRMAAAGLETQLARRVPGVTSPNRSLLAVLLAEEMAALLPPDSGSLFTIPPAESVELQLAAGRGALEQAAQMLDADQFALVEQFIQEQEQMAAGFVELWTLDAP